MTDFVAGPVEITVPATSANLGPGFDCLGLALSRRDRLSAEIGGDGARVEVVGMGAQEVPLDESHLVVRAMRRAFVELGVEPAGFWLRCENHIPHARGMGSSSAAIVGGLALARALVVGGEDRLLDADLLRLANELEGHPDNVAPALYGGVTVSGSTDTQVWAYPAQVLPQLRTVVFVPECGVKTEAARGLLPQAVSHADAAANTGRAALLVTALAAHPDALWRATEDYLHQSHREPAMPESLALIRALRAEGFAAVISGAGPTVLVIAADEVAARQASRFVPDQWQVEIGEVSSHGVTRES